MIFPQGLKISVKNILIYLFEIFYTWRDKIKRFLKIFAFIFINTANEINIVECKGHKKLIIVFNTGVMNQGSADAMANSFKQFLDPVEFIIICLEKNDAVMISSIKKHED